MGQIKRLSMAQEKSKPRRKARQSSIYRKLETLLGEMMAMSERIPKHASGMQVAGVRAINEILESLSTTEFALYAADERTRLSYLATIIHSMTITKTVCRELYDYSRKDRNEVRLGADGLPVTNDQGVPSIVKCPRYGRVLSHTQYVHLLGIFSELSKEIGRWYNSTYLKMSQVNK